MATRNFTPERLQQALLELASKLYSADFTRARREGFMEECRRGRIRPLLNLDGTGNDLAEAV